MDAQQFSAMLRAALLRLAAHATEAGLPNVPTVERFEMGGMIWELAIKRPADLGLRKMEQAILEAADERERKASDLADRADYSGNNRFLEALRNLVRLGLIVKSGVDAYRRA